MAQYTKHNSNYIKTGIHQKLKDGSTIFERDWVTIGSQLHFGPGKIPYYTNGNFIFTTSPIPHYQKRYKNGVAVGVWTYDDVKDATDTVNKINNDEYTEDIRTYAYYGSCVELVRSSIEHIIANFPANITLTEERLEVPPTTDEGEYTYINGFIVNNPFDINLFLKEVTLSQYDNELRFLSYSWDKYLINGEEITSYDISEWLGDIDCPQNDQYYISKSPVIIVTINNTYVLNGYKSDNDIVFCYEGDSLEIRPKEEYIEDYFNNLEGFEKQLLNRNSKPLYSNVFVTPIEYNLGYVYYKRTYTWPSKGYCIDINTTTYMEFLSKLTAMAEKFDELWTDNIWRRMTHEAIKNYDWTYTKEFEEGEEQDNIDGGERMHKVLNIIGRVFDDAKRNIDLIKKNNRITYNGDRNIPNALLTDKLELMGWDTYSTIPTITVEENYTDENGVEQTIERDISASDITIDDTFLRENNIKWYEAKNNNSVTFTDVDVSFMRKLLLSSKYILKTKGTRAAIDMIMGMFGYGLKDNADGSYSITETYRKVKPILYNEKGTGETESLGDKIIRLNAYKENERIYPDDEVSGIPVGSFKVQTNTEDSCEFTTYLIPYYDQRKLYDGDFTFQSKGGWLYQSKTVETNIDPFKWTETLSYLHVVSTIEDMLNVNPNSVSENDIYYVSNLSDYVNYTEEETLYSNFFILNNDLAPDLFSSWENIDLDEDNDNSKRAKYLDNIILDTIGNNPHVGFGQYDKGEDYFRYMKKPFKFAIDRNFFSYEDTQEADEIEFEFFNNKFIVSENKKFYYDHQDFAGAFCWKTDDNEWAFTFSRYPEIGETMYDDPITMETIVGEVEYSNTTEDFNCKTSSGKIKIFADKTDIDDYERLANVSYINIYNNNNNKFIVSKGKIYYYDHQDFEGAFCWRTNNNEWGFTFSYSPHISEIIFDNPMTMDISIGEVEHSDQTPLSQELYDNLEDDEKEFKYKKYVEYSKDAIIEVKKNVYNLNNKVVYLKNNIDNEEYKRYFKQVIMKYIMQVIPSTTILILQNFD